jgi:hypothetical protein
MALLRNKKNKGLFDPSKKVNTDPRIKKGGRFFKKKHKSLKQRITRKAKAEIGLAIGDVKEAGDLLGSQYSLTTIPYEVNKILTDCDYDPGDFGSLLVKYRPDDGDLQEVWAIKSNVPAKYDSAKLIFLSGD